MNLSQFAERNVTDSWDDILTICRRAGIRTWTNEGGSSKAVRQLSNALRNLRTRPQGIGVKWDSFSGTYLFRRGHDEDAWWVKR